MWKKLLIAAAVVALAPTGTALAHESGRYGYGGGGYYSGQYYGDSYRHHRYDNRRLNRYDRALRELRYAYRHGYISRWEYRTQRRALERERRWYNRRHRDRYYGSRW